MSCFTKESSPETTSLYGLPAHEVPSILFCTEFVSYHIALNVATNLCTVFFKTTGEGMPEAVGKIFLKIIIFLLHHLLQHYIIVGFS